MGKGQAPFPVGVLGGEPLADGPAPPLVEPGPVAPLQFRGLRMPEGQNAGEWIKDTPAGCP